MMVYPNNAIREDTLLAVPLQGHSNILDAVKGTLDIPVQFTVGAAVIQGTLHKAFSQISVILGNCSYSTATVSLMDWRGIELAHAHIHINNEFEIRNIAIPNSTPEITQFRIQFNNQGGGDLGFLYIGEQWRLPRFTVNPVASLSIQSEGGRTFTGQARGYPAQALKGFEAAFIHNKTYCIDGNGTPRSFDDYVTLVQSTEAHVIDPYYGRPKESGCLDGREWERPVMPPMLATIAEYDSKEKRNFDDFFWNVHLSWAEAR